MRNLMIWDTDYSRLYSIARKDFDDEDIDETILADTIEMLIDAWEKENGDCVYHTVSNANMFICTLPKIVQDRIEEEIQHWLTETFSEIPDGALERAMDSRLCDLANLIYIDKYLK